MIEKICVQDLSKYFNSVILRKDTIDNQNYSY
jgi:hypothetical protein